MGQDPVTEPQASLASLPERRRETARVVFEHLCQRFHGVLVGPQKLVRELVDEGRLGSRSTLEALIDLVHVGLVEQRETGGSQVLWVPTPVLAQVQDRIQRQGRRRSQHQGSHQGQRRSQHLGQEQERTRERKQAQDQAEEHTPTRPHAGSRTEPDPEPGTLEQGPNELRSTRGILDARPAPRRGPPGRPPNL